MTTHLSINLLYKSVANVRNTGTEQEPPVAVSLVFLRQCVDSSLGFLSTFVSSPMLWRVTHVPQEQIRHASVAPQQVTSRSAYILRGTRSYWPRGLRFAFGTRERKVLLEVFPAMTKGTRSDHGDCGCGSRGMI